MVHDLTELRLIMNNFFRFFIDSNILFLVLFFVNIGQGAFAQTDSLKQAPAIKIEEGKIDEVNFDSLRKEAKKKKNIFWLFKAKNRMLKDSTLNAWKDSLERSKKFKADSLALIAKMMLDTLYGYGEGKMSLPTRAALLSAALPGLGQYFNRSLWYLKVPVIYGLFGFTIYQTSIYHKQHILLRDALLYREDDNPLTVPDPIYATFDNQGLRTRRDAFRRERDFNIILTFAVYMLNIAEAAATAHLKSFDISDDLSLKIQPKTMLLPENQFFTGVSFNFQLHHKR
jgi:hypothetical protein